jgi:hypothetical protein
MNECPEIVAEASDQQTPDGIVKELGELPSGAILEEEAVARIFGRHSASVKRAVERGELPPSVRLFGKPTWTAGAILAHLDARLEAAKREAEKDAARLGKHNP